MSSKPILTICILICASNILNAQINATKGHGIEIITSGGEAADSLFIKLLKGEKAKVIFIPTAASALKSESGIIWYPDSLKNKDAFTKEISKRFHLANIYILHTRNRKEANSKWFVKPLLSADAIWISGGNPGRFMAAYRGTRLERELKKFNKNGGIIAGESAGAIVQGSYTIRGNPNKPVLMVKGSEKGISLLPDIAINPHLSNQKRENELITIIDKHPNLLGIGIDDDTGFIIRDGIGEVFGNGRIAIYDNQKHNDGWFYWLNPGDKFDFNKRLPSGILK